LTKATTVPVLDTIAAQERRPHAMILVSTCRRGCRALGERGLSGAGQGGCSDIRCRRDLAATRICRGCLTAWSRRSSARSSEGFRSPLARR